MRLSTSRVLSLASKSGLSTVGWPTSASTAVPPRAGFGTVATGWHPQTASTAANAAGKSLLRKMRYHPDVGDRADKKRSHQDPAGPVDLALQAAPRAVATAEPVAAAADGAAEARCLRRLDEHAGHQQHGEHSLGDDEGVLELSHRSRRFYPGRLGPDGSEPGVDRVPVQGVEPGC